MANVHYRFNGNIKFLDATVHQRMAVQSALAALQQELSRCEGSPTQISTEIRFTFSGSHFASENLYMITVTDDGYVPPAVPLPIKPAGLEHPAALRSSPGSEDEDDRTKARPSKRARTYDEARKDSTRGSIFDEINGAKRLEDVLSLLEKWQSEWKHQGGWLFDALNGNSKTAIDRDQAITQRLNTVESILGHSINVATVSTMAELGKISQYLSFLESCRKNGADEILARERTWQAYCKKQIDLDRRTRNATEERLNAKLEAQRRLLLKLAEASGVDVLETSDKLSEEPNLDPRLRTELSKSEAQAQRDVGRSNGSTEGNINLSP